MKAKNIFTNKAIVFTLALICCLLWGSAFPCIKIGCRLMHISSEDASSQILYAGLRFILAGIFALLIGSTVVRKPLMIKMRSFPKALKLSCFQTISQYTFFYIGLSRSTGMKSSVITASNVFLSILVAALVFRTEKLTLRKLLGCAVGFSGVVLINLSGIGGEFKLTGEGFVFLSALSYAFSSALIKKYSQTEDPVMLSGWQFVIGGMFMTASGLTFGGRISVVNTLGLLMLVYLAFVSATAFSLWSTLIKYNNVSTVSVFGFMNPVFGVVLSYLILMEKSSAGFVGTVVALFLVAAGIIIVNVPINHKIEQFKQLFK